MEYPDTSLPTFSKARRMVDAAIAAKGDVFQTRSDGRIVKTFEDRMCEVIFEKYVAIALEEVDRGNWQDAGEIARNSLIDETAHTLQRMCE